MGRIKRVGLARWSMWMVCVCMALLMAGCEKEDTYLEDLASGAWRVGNVKVFSGKGLVLANGDVLELKADKTFVLYKHDRSMDGTWKVMKSMDVKELHLDFREYNDVVAEILYPSNTLKDFFTLQKHNTNIFDDSRVPVYTFTLTRIE